MDLSKFLQVLSWYSSPHQLTSVNELKIAMVPCGWKESYWVLNHFAMISASPSYAVQHSGIDRQQVWTRMRLVPQFVNSTCAVLIPNRQLVGVIKISHLAPPKYISLGTNQTTNSGTKVMACQQLRPTLQNGTASLSKP